MDPACLWISDVSSDPGARSSTTLQSPQRHHRSNAGNAVALGADNCRALAALAALACTILQLLHLDANTAVTQQLQNSFTRQVLSCLKPEQTICRQFADRWFTSLHLWWWCCGARPAVVSMLWHALAMLWGNLGASVWISKICSTLLGVRASYYGYYFNPLKKSNIDSERGVCLVWIERDRTWLIADCHRPHLVSKFTCANDANEWRWLKRYIRDP